MGGKPKKNTPADMRLKENKQKYPLHPIIPRPKKSN